MHDRTGTRPDLASITTGKDLKRWYWRKEELVAYARSDLDLD